MADEDGDRRTRHCKDNGRQTPESPAGASRLVWTGGLVVRCCCYYASGSGSLAAGRMHVVDREGKRVQPGLEEVVLDGWMGWKAGAVLCFGV